MSGVDGFVGKKGIKRRSRSFWKKVVQEYEFSSLSQKDFCKEKGKRFRIHMA
jgi:hypothetical protein